MTTTRHGKSVRVEVGKDIAPTLTGTDGYCRLIFRKTDLIETPQVNSDSALNVGNSLNETMTSSTHGKLAALSSQNLQRGLDILS